MAQDIKEIDNCLAELEIIDQIVDRVLPMAEHANVSADRQEWVDYVVGCHTKTCALDLEELLTCSDKAFAYDMFGMRSHWDKHDKMVRDFCPVSAVISARPDYG